MIKYKPGGHALKYQSEHYPERFKGRVPKTIRIIKWIRGLTREANFGEVHRAWTNSHGAVSVVFPNGSSLGVTPDEFEVVDWYPESEGKVK